MNEMPRRSGPSAQVRTKISISVPQKDFQKVKKIMEKHLLHAGGTFVDKEGKNGVRSTYKLGKITEKYVWHRSFSKPSSLVHTKRDVVNLLDSLGVLKKMDLEGLSKSAIRKKMALHKKVPLDGELIFPPEFRDLEEALDELINHFDGVVDLEEEGLNYALYYPH